MIMLDWTLFGGRGLEQGGVLPFVWWEGLRAGGVLPFVWWEGLGVSFCLLLF